MRKLDDVLAALAKLQSEKKSGVSAADLSKYMNLDRANISRYLNSLYKEGRVDKTDGRPVIYSISCTVKNQKTQEDEFDSNSFDKIVGVNLSLQVPIQQGKAAMLYPPHGLHTLILGETGVGKSMFAEVMYKFAIESGVIESIAPFVRFNCADYADNPQLLIAQIFGVKKGAYTGAEKDKEGLLKKADGGVIFLDEIHRLSPQAQEMLFTYIDQGSFRPLGDTENIVHVEAQIIAATTEDPQSFMLRTFTRRIPMTITLPSLKERTIEERYYLLEQFIRGESVRLEKSIYFNKNALISFLLYDCPNNIGQLKSDIQLACAKAFLNYKANGKNFILIEQSDLHQRVKKGLMSLQDHRNEINKLLDNMGDVLRFSYKDHENRFSMVKEEDNIRGDYFYDIIERKLNDLKKRGLEEKEINDILNIDIDRYFKKYIRDLPREYRKDEIVKIVDVSIVDTVEEILALSSRKLNRQYDEKVYFGLALHLQGSLERIKQGNKIYHPKLNYVRIQYSEEFLIAMEAAHIIDVKFGIQVPLDEIGYLTMFIATRDCEGENKQVGKVGVLVIMHGHSTATSMVDVANSLIGESYVESLDMPLSMRAEEMYELARSKVVEMNSGKGVLLLVDMGSLTNFGDMIEEETGISVKAIDMTSTLIVIEAGRKALNGRDLDDIYKSCIEISRSGIQIKKISSEMKGNVIITACFTGEGSAERIKQILSHNLTNRDKVKIIPLNILDKQEFAEKVEVFKVEYNIVAIVGTVNINTDDIPFIPAPDILAGDGLQRLDEWINEEEDFVRISKSMNSQIEDIDGIGLVALVREAVSQIEERIEVKISHEVKVGIVIHLCFLIEKIINGGKGMNFDKLNEYRDIHSKEFILVKQSLRDLELAYNININDNELAFIVRMVTENSISV
ncbi:MULTISPECIES: sigma-54-dependent transcriptional regulator [Clostridium]|uniref:Sigma 54-interacting transcriptional regulator n=1 Tax=Clostridium cibarium TaxID=2762247 RepID=A0ABR8PWV0_9CLOT|nr:MULTISPECIES: sigma-54-dependent transcriptional regulator [Clostridium]MBD7912609.1 sigma 54-interacting transcriptional regulator [Clostridium cibarium]